MTESESLFSPLPKVVKKEFTLKQYFSSSNLSSVTKLQETEECSSFTFLAVSLFRVCVNSKAENCFLLIPQYSCNTFPPLRSCWSFQDRVCVTFQRHAKKQWFLAGSYSETTFLQEAAKQRAKRAYVQTNLQLPICSTALWVAESWEAAPWLQKGIKRKQRLDRNTTQHTSEMCLTSLK